MELPNKQITKGSIKVIFEDWVDGEGPVMREISASDASLIISWHQSKDQNIKGPNKVEAEWTAIVVKDAILIPREVIDGDGSKL